MSARPFAFTVAPPGGRLDRLLADQLPEVSRTRLQELIRSGHVFVDGLPAGRPGQRLTGDEHVRGVLPAPVPSDLTPEAIPLAVVFENADLLIVDKPAGMVVHPAAGHARGTLVHAALAHAPDLRGVGGELRPGVIHRLDKDTSGLILMAKHDQAHHFVQAQFKARTVEKVYLALVDGQPPTPQGRVEAPIGRDPRQRKRMAVLPEGRGRAAQTTYRTIEIFAEHALLEARPHTGRTHQIRLHLAFLGCPVLGDRVYGRRRPLRGVGRQMLHAWRVHVQVPGEQEPRWFEAPLPEDFEAVLADLRARGV